MRALQLLLVVATFTPILSKSVPPLRLIKTSESDSGKWLTQNEVFNLISQDIGFIDVTDSKNVVSPFKDAPKDIPTELKHQTLVRSLFPRINLERERSFVQNFSSYHTRYYDSPTGVESQLWLLEQVVASSLGYVGTIEVNEADHGWPQKSIIVRLTGADPVLRGEIVVLGAHLDSVNSAGATLNAPGADDNSSGAVAVLETLRVVVEAGLIFNRTVEFHWYAAEEIGLRGSQAIAEYYAENNVNVVGMLNFDVISHYTEGLDEIGIHTEPGDIRMSEFARLLTDEYLDFGWRSKSCGYGCSDHASWASAGYPAVFTNSAISFPGMHTVNDTIAIVNFRQVNEFNKLALAYVVEFGEPANA